MATLSYRADWEVRSARLSFRKALQGVKIPAGFARSYLAPDGVRPMLDKRSYETKFADFIGMCAEAEAKGVEVVLIADPHALGDNYDEMVESLNRLADAELHLAIVPRAERGKAPA